MSGADGRSQKQRGGFWRNQTLTLANLNDWVWSVADGSLSLAGEDSGTWRLSGWQSLVRVVGCPLLCAEAPVGQEARKLARRRGYGT